MSDLTEQNIELVQSSFAKVAPIADKAAEIFYARLFEIEPSVKPMFKGPMDEQGKKLMGTLSVVVNGLRDLDAIVPIAGNLAIKHVDYGVKAEHYDVVGQALIYTLHQGLGDDMTPETEAAWVNAYTVLSGAMIASAYNTEGA